MKSLLVFSLAMIAGSSLLAQTAANPAAAPAKNWEMKIFSKEGFRSMILRGSEVRVAGPNRYDVVDLSITIFAAKGEARVDSILLSPAATFLARENRATGEKAVRLIHDDMEITGEQWTYDHAARKVTIQKNSRVVFHSPLPDLIR